MENTQDKKLYSKKDKIYSFCKLIIFIIIDDDERRKIYITKHIFIRDMKNILTELKSKLLKKVEMPEKNK